jgi:PAS domain S-box-containing protein
MAGDPQENSGYEKGVGSHTDGTSSFLPLQEENAFRTAVIERAAEGLCVCHGSDEFPFVRFSIWNGRMTEITGHTLEQINRQGWCESLYPDPEHQARARERMARLRQGEDLAREEWEITRRDGGKRRVLVSGSVIRVGAREHVLLLMQDVTEQRQLERRMAEAQKLESLGALAGGVAHDFNNLLTGIIGGAEVALLDLEQGHPAREALCVIQESALRAAELSRQMLAYSGKGRFVVERVDLSAMVRSMSPLFDVSAKKRCEFVLDLDPNVPLIEADAGQLRHAVMNLVTNAVEASTRSPNSVRIVTRCERFCKDELERLPLAHRLTPGRYVVLRVIDSGEGMDERTVAHAFDPFFSTKLAGRGLGLPVVLGVIRGHGGAIRLTSTLGRGTSVEILLPPSAEAPPSLAPPRAEDFLERGRALLIDDEAMIRSIGKRMLERLGFEVELAEDGHAGVSLLRSSKSPFSLVLLDMTMPGLNGLETYKLIHELAPGLPVLLMSGYNEQEAVRDFQSEHLAGFIQKPFGLPELSDKVRLAATLKR